MSQAVARRRAWLGLTRQGGACHHRPMEIGYPDVSSQPVFGRKNLSNALLLLALPVPAIVCSWVLFHWFPSGAIPPAVAWEQVSSADQLAAFLLAKPVLSP